MTQRTQSSIPTSGSATTEGLFSSGTSPGQARLHLVGPGAVGRALLELLPTIRLALVAVSDSGATLYSQQGFDRRELQRIAEHKRAGQPLAEYPGAQRLPVELALELVAADVVIDAASTSRAEPERALARVRAALRVGSRVALASKDALALAADELLGATCLPRVGAKAALGGTGQLLQAELLDLREDCTSIALVANASTAAVLEELAQGADLAAAVHCAQRSNWLEPDPAADLEGADAALKLAAVACAVFGWHGSLDEIPSVTPEQLEHAGRSARGLRGHSARLVARATPDESCPSGVCFHLGYELLERSNPLCAPLGRVAYTYALGSGETRVHLGSAIGPERTARALLDDVHALALSAAGAA